MTQKPAVSEIVIRPSMKLIRVAYTLVFAVVFVCVLVYANSSAVDSVPAWVAFLPALLFLLPIQCHIRNRFTLMALAGDKLRYETGILSRSKRVIQLTKVQDVRVEQTLVQRMLRIGNLSVETAGETSLLTMRDVDEPDAVTEEILRAAHGDAGDRAKPQSRL
jgi:membrane protein YdbS with pleckstrin-like domain